MQLLKRLCLRTSPEQQSTSAKPTGPEGQPTATPADEAIADIWKSALERYHRSVGIDLQNAKNVFVRTMEMCRTIDEILRVLDDATQQLTDRRRGNKRLRSVKRVLSPVVVGLGTILDTGAETGSALVRQRHL